MSRPPRTPLNPVEVPDARLLAAPVGVACCPSRVLVVVVIVDLLG